MLTPMNVKLFLRRPRSRCLFTSTHPGVNIAGDSSAPFRYFWDEGRSTILLSCRRAKCAHASTRAENDSDNNNAARTARTSSFGAIANFNIHWCDTCIGICYDMLCHC